MHRTLFWKINIIVSLTSSIALVTEMNGIKEANHVYNYYMY